MLSLTVPLHAVGGDIAPVTLNTNQDLEIQVPADDTQYFRVLSGTNLNSVSKVLAISLTNTFELSTTNSPIQFFRVETLPRSAPLDSDGDGFNDLYELQHPGFLDPLSNFDPNRDSDVDGVSNVEEYRAGTDPFIPDLGFTFPNLLAGAPNVTGSGPNAASAIANSQLIGPGSPQFRYLGGRGIPMANPAFFHRHSYAITNSGYPGSIGDNRVLPFSVEFSTAASEFEVLEYGSKVGYRYWIDGKMVSDTDFLPAIPSGLGDGKTYLRHFQIVGRSGAVEPDWPVSPGAELVDENIQWRAELLPGATSTIDSSDWEGASGATPPTGWDKFGAPQFEVADHDGQTNALHITVAGVGNNTYKHNLVVGSSYGVSCRLKVISGQWQLSADTGNYTPVFTTNNAGVWTTVQFTLTAPRVFMSISPRSAGDIWVDDFRVYLLPDSDLPPTWSAGGEHQVDDLVVPSTGGAFAYRDVGTILHSRVVRVDLDGLGGFGGVRLPADAQLLPLDTPRQPKCVVFGDSYTVGTGTLADGYVSPSFVEAHYRSWAYALCNLMGWECWSEGSGGSGYLEPGDRGPYGERIQSEVIDEAPDIVVLSGGFNDINFDPADVAAEFRREVAQIRAALPTVPIISVGPWMLRVSQSHPTPQRIAINQALREAAADLQVPYVDPIETGWITGDWGAPHSGNANSFFDDDGAHPNSRGHEYLGLHIASEVRRLLANRPPKVVAEVRLDQSSWGSAEGTSPPVGWANLGNLTFHVADHLDVPAALNVSSPAGTDHNFYYGNLLKPEDTGYNWRPVRITFKMRVTLGSVFIGTFGPGDSPIRFNRIISTRSRLVGEDEWVPFEDPLNGINQVLSARNFSNCSAWTEYEVTLNSMQNSLSFFALSSSDPETSYWLKDVKVEVLKTLPDSPE